MPKRKANPDTRHCKRTLTMLDGPLQGQKFTDWDGCQFLTFPHKGEYVIYQRYRGQNRDLRGTCKYVLTTPFTPSVNPNEREIRILRKELKEQQRSA